MLRNESRHTILTPSRNAMAVWQTPKAAHLRYCAKIALASVAAYALTAGGRDEYALYTMLGASLVVGGSLGEDLDASFSRIRGTLVGAVVGGIVAYAAGNSVGSLAITVASLAWLCIGLGWGTSALRVAIAMALVMVFSHVDEAAEYGIWRVLNTLIGVAIGVAVSRLVWPILGRQEVAQALDRAIDAMSATLAGLAGGASSDAMLPLQREMLDAMAAVRTARNNARLARQLDPRADLLSERTLELARAGIDTLGLSIRMDELVQAEGSAECVDAARSLIGTLSSRASKRLDAADADQPMQADALRKSARRASSNTTCTLGTTIAEKIERIDGILHRMRSAG